MANAWQTLEEAALTLGISSRTLHRRLSKGEFQTRLANGRREVLVTLDDADASSDPSEHAEVRQQLSAFARRAAMLAEREHKMQSEPAASRTGPVSDAGQTSSLNESRDEELSDVTAAGASDGEPTMLALHEDRIRRTDLAVMAYQQSVNVFANNTRRAHLSARVAWGLAACVIAGGFVAGIWITHTLTRAQAEVDHLHQVVRQLSDTADARSHEADMLRAEAEAAHLASARMEGELSAVRQEIASQRPVTAAPATQPSATISGALGPIMQRITLR